MAYGYSDPTQRIIIKSAVRSRFSSRFTYNRNHSIHNKLSLYQFIQLINKLMDIFRSLIRSISIVIHEFFFFCGTLCISRSVRENASLNIKRREIFNNKKRNIYCFTQCLHSFQSSGDSTFRHYIRSVFVFDLVWFDLIWFDFLNFIHY